MAADYIVLSRARLADRHVPTGKTVHYRVNDVLPPPHSLQIAQYPGDEGYYLLYLHEQGREQADTYHGDVRSAMGQAEFEFGVKATEWKKS
jgi:hypothetical protein